MKNVRYMLIALLLLMGSAVATSAGVSIGIGLPNLTIGINIPTYPDLVPVPGYPVYYAPQLDANYFFYDGMYWVFSDDNWYTSSWYNGPWALVDPLAVPAFILRIPVQYYRHPPAFFSGWRADRAPLWGKHWGNDWNQNRKGWNKWRPGTAPKPAPLPTYQRAYTKGHYPEVQQQHQLHSEQYKYQPREKVIQQHYQQHGMQHSPERGHR